MEDYLNIFIDYELRETRRVYSKDGVLQKEVPHINHVKEGIQKDYFLEQESNLQDGHHQLANVRLVTPFIEGLIHGTQIHLTRSGTIEMTAEWKFGLQDGQQVLYYPSGNIRKVVNYVLGLLQGIGEVYSDTPARVTIERMRFLDDRVHGDYEYFFQDGSIQRVLPVVHGIPNGLQLEYNQQGNVIGEQLFVGGFIQQQQFWEEFIQVEIRTQDPDFTDFTVCPICYLDQQNIADPIALFCDPRHIFCRGCIEKHVQTTSSAKCPICRGQI